VVDWLVCMTRLPADRMLDARITVGLAAGQGPTLAEVGALANALNRFYLVQRLRRPLRGVYFGHLTKEQAANTQNLMELGHHLPSGAPVALLADLTERLVASQTEIAGREEAHLIVEGHGDLRPEHVCLTSPPVIFDRVETAQEMRIIDIYDEMGNLANECALLGRPDLRAVLFEPMLTTGLELPSHRLMATYGMFRLVTRARLSLDHLRDTDCKDPAKWIRRATDYLAAAAKISSNDRFDRVA
jgi:aminoglycoside phosphotransferase family enzyme